MNSSELQECLAYAWTLCVEGLHFETGGLIRRAIECYVNANMIRDLVYECNRRYPPAIIEPSPSFVELIEREVEDMNKAVRRQFSVSLWPTFQEAYLRARPWTKLYLRIRHWKYFRDGKQAAEGIWSFFRCVYTTHLLMKSWDQIKVRTLYDEYGNIIFLMSEKDGEA
jgi:hypothetical protein